MRSDMTRREILLRLGLTAGFAALGPGSFVARASGAGASIRVGILTDLSGPIGVAGPANVNIAKLVVDDINAHGGLLGRQLDLVVVDSASDPQIGVTKARELVEEHDVDVVLGGITSAMRDAIKGTITGGGKLYIYPTLYEGGECHADIFCTGATPNQQAAPFVPWLIANGGKKFYLPSSDYVWPHGLNAAVKAAVENQGGKIVGEEYFPLDMTEFSATVEKIMGSGANVVFNTVIPPGLGPFLSQLYDAGFTKRGGRLACVYFDEGLLNFISPEKMEGLASCLDYFESIDDQFSNALAARYKARFPGSRFNAGSAATGMYRGLAMWANAVKEAGSLEKTAVREALDHARITQGPGGAAAMVPGQHHVRMNMYIAVARRERYEIIKNLGVIDPKECVQGIPQG